MKHIMLLFLSEVRLNPDCTLSFSRYKNPDGTIIYCVQANESAVRRTADVLQKQGERLDCLFYFSTKRTQEEICYIDEVGDERTMTHEALFRERVQSFAAHCIGIDYDESMRNEESIRRALSMADTMGTFMEAQLWQPEDVELHVDVTGGFRHASMMMLAVIQLLKYRGIRTMSVLSSNRHEQQVENVTDIYRMFNLISGADEFINFGSTREIMDYMEGAEQTTETKLLLETMRDFTNAVRICRTGKIAPLAKELQEALRNFERAGAVSLQEKIFLRILEVFKSEYGSLLKEDFTNFDIIRWCVEKGYLQQAMTLCSEWIPGEIVGRHIFYPIKDAVIEKCIRGKVSYQTWQQHFLNGLIVGKRKKKRKSSLKNDSEAPRNEECDMISAEYENSEADTISEESRFDEALEKDFLSRRDESAEEHKGSQKDLAYEGVEKDENSKESLSHRALKDDLPSEGYISGIYCDDVNWNDRQANYLRLINNGEADYMRPGQATLELLYNYYQIRIERNNINHANGEGCLSTEKIKDLVLDLLRRMENIAERE